MMARSWPLIAMVLVLLAAGAAAVCPTNGDPRVLYVTANGDGGFHDILMLDTSGRPVGTAINWTSVPETVVLRKLRGMAFGPDGKLYVASALGRYSKIVAFKAELEADCTRRFDRVVVSIGSHQRYLKHPYAVLPVFHPNITRPRVGSKGTKEHPAFTLFTTNQNTVSVTWFNGLDGTPLPSPPATVSRALVRYAGEDGSNSSAWADADGRARRHVQRMIDDGVFAADDEEKGDGAVHLRSVRGAALSPDGTYLLVADVDSDAVRVYDVHRGRYLWSIRVAAPIQVAFAPKGFFSLDGGHPAAEVAPHVLITTKTNAVFIAPVVDPSDESTVRRLVRIMRRAAGQASMWESNFVGRYDPPVTPAEASRALAPRVFTDGDFSATSAIEFDAASGVVYIADRVERRIYRVRFDGHMIGRFGPKLNDQPEHLLLVTIADPADLPRCYELGAVGLKYSVICVAGWIWAVLAVVGATLLLAMRRWHRGQSALPFFGATDAEEAVPMKVAST